MRRKARHSHSNDFFGDYRCAEVCTAAWSLMKCHSKNRRRCSEGSSLDQTHVCHKSTSLASRDLFPVPQTVRHQFYLCPHFISSWFAWTKGKVTSTERGHELMRRSANEARRTCCFSLATHSLSQRCCSCFSFTWSFCTSSTSSFFLSKLFFSTSSFFLSALLCFSCSWMCQ